MADISGLNVTDLRAAKSCRSEMGIGADYVPTVIVDVLDPGLAQRFVLPADVILAAAANVVREHRACKARPHEKIGDLLGLADLKAALED